MAAQDNDSDALSLDIPCEIRDSDDAKRAFQVMRMAIEGKGEKSDDEISSGFAAAAISLGTHGPKLVNPRSPDKPFTPEITESDFRKHYSGDGKYSRYAKVLLRPISISGQSNTNSFVERIEVQSNSSSFLEEAFELVFGFNALTAVKSGLQEQKQNLEKATAHYENFPMIFTPGPSSDLVLTPITSFSTLSIMYNIKNDGYEAAKNSDASAGSYHKTEIADKVQNTAIGIPKNRLRFFAQMPIVLERREAEIHAWIRGGPIPRMRDSDIAMRLEKYAELLKIAQAQPLVPSAKDKIDNLADWLIADAYQHIDDIVTDAGVDAPHPPRPAFVLSRNVSRDKRNLCKNALRSGHFQHRLSVFKVKR